MIQAKSNMHEYSTLVKLLINFNILVKLYEYDFCSEDNFLLNNIPLKTKEDIVVP